jgi:hypothetical protein
MTQIKLQSRVADSKKTAASVKAATQSAGAKKRRTTRVETYSSYIYKVRFTFQALFKDLAKTGGHFCRFSNK